ncbi:ImmA/IrrE family metallo-endopeptidase, partial [Enterococcus faecium]|nr:ImmA/IrrE family metallo-endopeptidase [Enterococcus faecium]
MIKPDYQAATFQAHRTFYFMTNKEYPVNTLQIVKKLPNTKLATYEEFANAIHQSVDFVSQEIGKNNDAFTLSRGEEFIIVYNSDITTNIVERIRFSIAHELGHIILNHFSSGDLILTRGGLSEERYKILEKEADTFARELLAPTFLMQPEKWSIKQVCDIFDVSK